MRGLAMGLALGCVPLSKPGYAKRAIGRVDQLEDYVVLPDADPNAELSRFGCPPV